MSKTKTEEVKEKVVNLKAEESDKKGEETKPKVELSESELILVEQQRRQNLIRANCASEIEKVLSKYGANLQVDPRSPISQPRIVVTLRN